MKRVSTLAFLILSIVACQKYATPDIKTLISSHDEDESHNKGQNCMDCHYSAGNAEGIFTLAGSAYGNTNNGFFELYENQSNEPIMTIPIDRLGNAYTTEAIDFGNGLWVATRSSNGEVEFMDDRITSGQCNLCHGTGIEENIDMD